MATIELTVLKNMTYNGQSVHKWYHNMDSIPFYYEITYYVDTNISYKETIKQDLDILNPVTFTPTKSGYTFVGWRENTTANSSVLASKPCAGNTTLYAVFSKEITKTFISYNSTQTYSGTMYYNNGNSTNASIAVPTGASYTGWTWRGWSAADTTTANASVAYANGATISDNTSGTYYGLYSATVTISYNANGGSGSVSSQSGTKYWNAFGTILEATFSLRSNAFTYTNLTFQKWAMGSKTGVQYAAGASVAVTEDTTFYAVWKATAVSNKKLYSGSGGVSQTIKTFDTTGYSSVTISLKATSIWAWMWLYKGTTAPGTYTTHTRSGYGDGVESDNTTTYSITLPANSGVQSFGYAVTPDNSYGGYDTNTSWEIRVTAS